MIFRKCLTAKEDLCSYAEEKPSEATIRLDLITNPLGFPKRILSILDSIQQNNINHYNQPAELPELKLAIASRHQIEEDQIMLTAGADQAIEIVLTHLLDSEEALGILIPTFPRFEIVARRLCNARIKFFRELEELPKDCKVICLCTPNNPTTEELNIQELEKAIKENNETFFVIDAVFSEFGKRNPSDLIKKFENVAVLKSLSKSFGLPGLRVGWIESQKENIKMFKSGISPFRVPLICQQIATEALKDQQHILKTIEFLDKEFEKIKIAFGERVVRKSCVPFFLFKIENPEKARKELLDHDISVVDSASFKSEIGFLRIAIGSEKENSALLKALKEIF